MRWQNKIKKGKFLYVNSLSLRQFIDHLNSHRITISDIDNKSYYDLCRWWDKVEWNGIKFVNKK